MSDKKIPTSKPIPHRGTMDGLEGAAWLRPPGEYQNGLQGAVALKPASAPKEPASPPPKDAGK